MKKWFAVYTKPGTEKKVADQLEKSGFEAFCPIQIVIKGRDIQRKKEFEQSLVPQYVFVKLNREQLPLLRSINNIVTLVYWLGDPVIIRDIEIEMIQRFLSEHKNVQLKPTAVAIGEIVKLVTGQTSIEQQGDVILVKNAVEKLVLPSLGFNIEAHKETQNDRYRLKVEAVKLKADY